jgi:ferritin-like metal-binding protein YciE
LSDEHFDRTLKTNLYGYFNMAKAAVPLMKELSRRGRVVRIAILAGVAAMPKAEKTLDELFHDTLKDIFYAEKKILTALPKMAKAAQNPDLKAAFEKHRVETEGQISRLEQVFEILEKKPQGKKCAAIEGIIEEGQEIAKEYRGSPARDSGLLAAAQAVEHYEISRYGTLRTWAQELGLAEAVRLLEATLKEEKKTDEALTALAETCVNQEAQSKAA